MWSTSTEKAYSSRDNDNNDSAEVAVDVAPQSPFNNEPDISTNPVFNTQDVYALDDLRLVSTPKIGVNGLIIKVIGNVKTALVVPKVTYTWPYLKFFPTVMGPIVTILFNWFFLSSWVQYMYQKSSLKLHLNFFFIAPIKD
ncbi:hypothetical protein Ahy_B10g104325 [Arachis hypogaea]|uniref:Uncharacterized protein n=1 Tax=Arachis hypogaea TaxID=3818 RepID=A0A444X584_ARAHY|nr:hypothetical protein Ahy_B10g104325 [Arachis hypogaea]